ncbi:chemotaxis protein CheW [Porticoccus sp.]
MTPYLLFSVESVCYGVEADAVREIGWLPELTPAEGGPPHIAGLVDLRGAIEPVMNLGQRLGHPAPGYQLSDNIVMLQAGGVNMGIVVSEALAVVNIPAAAIETAPHFDAEPAGKTRFIAGYAKVDDKVITLLDVQHLIHAPALPVSGVPAGVDSYFHPGASAEQRAIFRERARRLGQVADGAGAAERVPLSIIQLGGEYFGLGLDVVREFSTLHRVIPIPCCPPHIAGNMNLRGDILTLVDIRRLLNLRGDNSATAVAVIESGDLCIGVPVDRVLEVVYLHAGDIGPLPAAAHDEKKEYCRGATRYGTEMVSVLDMQKILSRGGLEVEEEV